MIAKNKEWYSVSNIDEIDSPALLVYPDRAAENIRRMIAAVGDPARLCPHVKTHKLAELVRLQLQMGITKFKCATIAEAEMVAAAGAPDALLAYQLVGPKLPRFLQLMRQYPQTKFSALVDNEATLREVSRAAVVAGTKVTLLIDIDCGMARSGIAAGAKARELYQLLATLPGVIAGGLHVYDGHLQDTDLAVRSQKCEAAFAPAAALRDELLQAGLPIPRVIAGGTPTFPIHARRAGVECSPGTSVLWDQGYTNVCPDLDFLHAALVLTRVVSQPGSNRLCLDLGHKAIAAENPHPRVFFLNLPDAKAVGHSEEHLVVEVANPADFPVGTVVYGVPRHVCPTVALHAEAVVIKDGRAAERWSVDARSRRLKV